MKSHQKLKISILFLLRLFLFGTLILFVSCIIYYLQVRFCGNKTYHSTLNNQSFYQKSHLQSSLSSSFIRKDKNKPTIFILLQQSPVNVRNQYSRLKNIDTNSWGLWLLPNHSSNHSIPNIGIYASVPIVLNSSLNNNRINNMNIPVFQRVNVLRLTYPSTLTINPFYHLVRGLISILIKEPQLEWLLLANDHTFIIPSNLECLLKKYNPEVGFYSGNKLQRGIYKKDYVLYFASGGAGIVLSYVSIKLFLISLAITNNQILIDIFKLLQSDMEYNQMLSKCLDNSNDNDNQMRNRVIGSDMNIGCLLMNILNWVNLQPKRSIDQIANNMKISDDTKIDISSQTTIILSKSSSLSSSSSPSYSFVTLSLYYNNQSVAATIKQSQNNHPYVSITSAQCIDMCTVTSSWDEINPALVLAYCLQRGYQIPFTSSTSTTITTTTTNEGMERFNCFGVVRSLEGDVDEWYTVAKLPYDPNPRNRITENMKDKIKEIQKPIAMAKEVISFHYVSEKESELLYRILSKQMILSSPKELESQWPKSDRDAGYYSRWRFQSGAEIERLYHYLTSYFSIQSC